MKFAIVTPWHQEEQKQKFLRAWYILNPGTPEYLFLQQDKDREGCAITKNRGIHRAIAAGAEVIIVLDDDCFPSDEATSLWQLAQKHIAALDAATPDLFLAVTDPPSRGTPYFTTRTRMPVSASMGFWTNIGDYDAPAQLVRGAEHPMTFKREIVYGRYFPLCGMNLAFKAEWWPICQFIDVPRFDDIWQGFIWQKIAYARGCCFNLAGPLVTHSRQSNVWANLRAEAPNLEHNETVWQRIMAAETTNYAELVKLLPAPVGEFK